MGQTIEINKAKTVGDVLVIDSDRSIAGQDGVAYVSAIGASRSSGIPAILASRLFETDPDIDHVFVMSNTVSIRRRRPWSDETVAAATGVVSKLFNFYG